MMSPFYALPQPTQQNVESPWLSIGIDHTGRVVDPPNVDEFRSGSGWTVFYRFYARRTPFLQDWKLASLQTSDNVVEIGVYLNRYNEMCMRWKCPLVSAKFTIRLSAVDTPTMASMTAVAIDDRVLFLMQGETDTTSIVYPSAALAELVTSSSNSIHIERKATQGEVALVRAFPTREQHRLAFEYFRARNIQAQTSTG
jgi:hypothetical protein